MPDSSPSLPQTELAPGLAICRIVTGLWQMADQEREGRTLDLEAAAADLAAYARDGFTTFDMADHYGSAEIVAGKARRLMPEDPPTLLTKWCPEPGPMTAGTVRQGVETALERMGVDRIDLMQFHWWRYEHPGYLDAMAELMRLRQEGLIGHLGVTNFDAAHLRVLVRNGIEIASNQVSFSLLDRRAAARMSDACAELGVRLLAFGTLAGGFLSERWLDAPEPGAIDDWSKMKYRRFIDTAGGWQAYQGVLKAADTVARRHGQSIPNVATRWVLDHDATAAVIVGARLGENQHRADNARLFSFEFDDEDHETLDAALGATTPIPGDCGDEYRVPPFLTASGDLSHHLASGARIYASAEVPARPDRTRVDTGSEWEIAAGFSRAVRIGDRILVSGTTATDIHGNPVCPGDVEGQTTFILDKIAASLEALGSGIEDVVRTRIYLVDKDTWPEAARVHGHVFRSVLPANTLIEAGGLIGPYEVEIEAEAAIAKPAGSQATR